MDVTDKSCNLPESVQKVLQRNRVGSVSSVKLVTVEQLQRQPSSFSSSLCDNRPQSQKIQQEIPSQGWTILPEKRYVLQGHITATPKTRNSQALPSQLYFEDHTLAIKCEVADEVEITQYKKAVLLVQWNFIEQDGDYHLEIQTTVNVEDYVEPNDVIKVVDVCNVRCAMDNRERLTGNLLNVVGTVTALSEPIRVRTTCMFLVQVSQDNYSKCVNILIKTNSRMYWQNFICPQEDYIFTNMRPTAMKKGSNSEQIVLVPWDHAKFYPVAKVQWKTVTLQELFNWKTSDLPDPPTESSETHEQRETPRQKLYNYQGVITDTSRADHGVYELDGKIRLYLPFVGGVKRFYQLREGTRVFVSNAHHKGTPEPPKVRLCCCGLSCIKVQEFSAWNTPIKILDANSYELHLVSKLGLGLQELMWLECIKEKVEKKLCPNIVRGEIHNVLKKILSSPSAVTHKQLLPPMSRTRNPVQEFMLPDHQGCPLLVLHNGCLPYIFPSVTDIIPSCQKEAENLKEFKELYAQTAQSSAELNNALYWHYKVMSNSDYQPPWVLIGMLQTCKKTGHVQLVDQMGRLNCVIAPHPVSGPRHSCSSSCVEGDGKFLCPYPQIWHMGLLVRVDLFQVVIEKFVVSNFPSAHQIGDQGFVKSLKTNVYVMFSMLDVVVLSTPKGFMLTQRAVKDVTGRSAKLLKSGTNLKSSTSACANSNKMDGECLMFDEETFDGARARKRKTMSTSAAASTSAADKDYYVTQLFFLAHKDSLSVKKRVNEKPKLSFYALVTFIGKYKIQNCRSAGCRNKSSTPFQSCSALPVKHMALGFYGEEVRWYPLLHVGNIYRLVRMGCRDPMVFQCKVKHSGLQWALNSTNARQYVVVESGTEIVSVPAVPRLPRQVVDVAPQQLSTPVCHQVEDIDPEEAAGCSEIKAHLESEGDLATFVNIRNLTLDSCKQKLVSIRGMVFSTTFCPPDTPLTSKADNIAEQDEKDNEKLEYVGTRMSDLATDAGVSVPQNRSIRLVVKDVETCDEILVYIRPDNISYPLGLIRGTMVEFEKLEVKISRKNHLYCQYLVASSYRVIQLPGEGASIQKSPSGKSSVDLKSLPQQYLRELWFSPAARAQFFTICHVQQVLRLTICSRCVECGTRHQAGTCTNPSCMSRALPTISAKASVMVEDGTASALVYCTSSLVRDLLSCTSSEWSALETAAAEQGELYYNRYSNDGGEQPVDPVSQWLKIVCQSSEVQCSITLYARHNRSARSKCQNLSGLDMKEVDIGGQKISTRSLPLLQLEALAIRKTACQDYINALMSSVPQ